jgi:dihydroorotate dehydrogenase (fumarate)
VASASPLTGSLEILHELEAAGAGAVVLPSLFEEQIEHEEVVLHDVLEQGVHSFGEALTYFPELDDYNTGPGRYLSHLSAAKAALRIPVIASLNGVSPGGWLRYAALCEEAGADAIELNVYTVEADPRTRATEVEERLCRIVRDVRDAVNVPLAVKVSPFYTAFAGLAVRIVEQGASGIVCFNRFVGPDIDLDALAVEPVVRLSTSDELRLALRWIAILRGRVDASLAATGGAHTASDVLKLLLAGADVVMLASGLLERGPRLLTEILAGVSTWLSEREYDSIEQLKGSLSQISCPDPSAFERAHYMRALAAYERRAGTSLHPPG